MEQHEAASPEGVATDETSSLISASKVEGTKVYNRQGETLGSIEDIMIDKRSGKVSYAIMAFGGFLGIGHSHHPLPWDMLDYDEGQDGYVVDLNKETLKDAPSYSGSDVPDWQGGYGRSVDEHYAGSVSGHTGVTPPRSVMDR